MVVDDEPDMLAVCKMSINACGYEVETFSDPMKALERFKENPSGFFAVLSDIRMPKMNGIELTKELIKIKRDCIFILMTAFEVDDRIFTDLPTVKREDVVSKPFDPMRLCTTIKARSYK